MEAYQHRSATKEQGDLFSHANPPVLHPQARQLCEVPRALRLPLEGQEEASGRRRRVDLACLDHLGPTLVSPKIAPGSEAYCFMLAKWILRPSVVPYFNFRADLPGSFGSKP